MAELTFKSFRELNEYLIDNELLDLEELTEVLMTEAEMEGEAEAE